MVGAAVQRADGDDVAPAGLGAWRRAPRRVIAAMPEENATAASACSSAASALSKRATVGFHSRA